MKSYRFYKYNILNGIMAKNKDVKITITLECINCAQDSEEKKKVFLYIPLGKNVVIHPFD